MYLYKGIKYGKLFYWNKGINFLNFFNTELCCLILKAGVSQKEWEKYAGYSECFHSSSWLYELLCYCRKKVFPTTLYSATLLFEFKILMFTIQQSVTGKSL